MALRASGRLRPVPVLWFAGQSATLPAIGVSTDTTDGADVLGAAVDPVAAGTSASTDGADTLAASVGPVVAASEASADGADVAAGLAGPVVAASSPLSDGADALAAGAAPLVAATSARSDGADVLAAAAGPLVGSTSASTDGADTLAAAVSAVVGAQSPVTEAADVLASGVAPVIAASSGRTDGADAAAANVATVIDLGSTHLDGADLFAAIADATTAVVLVPYRNPRMSDITTVWSTPLMRGDWVQAGAALQSGADVVTGVLISLFTDRVANGDDEIPDGTGDPRGWWADDTKYPIGSRLWLLGREKQLDRVPQRAQDYCKEALQWMLDDGVVAKFDITAAWVRTSLLGIQVTAHRQGSPAVSLKFTAAWNLSGITLTVDSLN